MNLKKMTAVTISTLALVAATSMIASSAPRITSTPTPPPTPTGPGGFTGPLPDLRPIESRMLTGTVSIKNFGPGPSAASVATVVCQKVGARGGGHCPDPGRIPEFESGAYPNAVVVNIPALAAGHVYSLELPFWDALVWPSGSYNLTVTADAGATVAETNEGNNVGVAVKVVP